MGVSALTLGQFVHWVQTDQAQSSWTSGVIMSGLCGVWVHIHLLIVEVLNNGCMIFICHRARSLVERLNSNFNGCHHQSIVQTPSPIQGAGYINIPSLASMKARPHQQKFRKVERRGAIQNVYYEFFSFYNIFSNFNSL